MPKKRARKKPPGYADVAIARQGGITVTVRATGNPARIARQALALYTAAAAAPAPAAAPTTMGFA